MLFEHGQLVTVADCGRLVVTTDAIRADSELQNSKLITNPNNTTWHLVHHFIYTGDELTDTLCDVVGSL